MNTPLVVVLMPVLAGYATTGGRTSATPDSTTWGPIKIVGGESVSPGELPYMVSIQDTRWGSAEHFCGGSVYDYTTIISAAHCFSMIDLELVQVVAGEHDCSKDEGFEQVSTIKKIILHPDFNDQTYMNDIAIIKLMKPLHYTDHVQPLRLPPSGVKVEGECLVSGWGALEENGQHVNTPKKLEVPIWSREDCSNSYNDYVIYESMMCAGYEEGGKDACHRDSGGPLACESDETTYLGGVVSWGYGCARPFRPSIYTDLTFFEDWLMQHTS
ncbi:trypsin-1-like isoform X2 [Homarus americanus]|uniref:trypsin-1-like isoform X2 n=1 Tax=Homarus americanus TaxID=6706 RepID=UPI001C43A519|nr:trypsin-1-like isoform X2 [Homarus americanus]